MDIKTLSSFERKIILNIWELYEEAKWLYKLGHYARAYALAHLAFEENAKLTLLTFLAWDIFMGKSITSDDIHGIFSGKLFTNHKMKLRIAFLKLPGYDYQTTVRQINALNILKNKSIYSDILDGAMYKPSDFFGKKQASSMVDIAKVTLQKRVEELGVTSLKKINRITDEMIENYYMDMKKILDAQRTILNVPSDVSFVDYLMEVIKNEELFNRLKQIF